MDTLPCRCYRLGTRQSRGVTLACLIAVTSWLTACDHADQERLSFTILDSAGLRIVELPDLKHLDVPEWRARRRYSTRGLEVDLYNITDAAFLPDSTLVILNAGNSELVVLGADGRLERHVGRRGEGPGEFDWPQSIGVDSSGSFWVFDRFLHRITWFDPSFEVWNTQRAVPDRTFSDIKVLTVLADGRSVAVRIENRDFGIARDTVPLLVQDPVGHRIDTLGLWPGDECAFASFGGGTARVPVGFGRRLFSDARGGRIAIGSTDSLYIQVFDQLKPTLILRGANTPEPVPDQEVVEWRHRIGQRAPVEVLRELWENGPVRETAPAFEGLKVDDAGRLWVGCYSWPSENHRCWVITNSDGVPLAKVELPVVFQRPYEISEVLAIWNDLVALRFRGEFDEEYVEVWRYSSR